MVEIIEKETTVTRGGQTSAGEPPTLVTPKVEEHRKIVYYTYYLVGVLEVLLAFRLVLKMFGANPLSPFVSFVYTLSNLFVWPFTGIFRSAVTTGVETTAVLEPATIIAMVVYAVLGWGLAKLIVIGSGRSPEME